MVSYSVIETAWNVHTQEVAQNLQNNNTSIPLSTIGGQQIDNPKNVGAVPILQEQQSSC